MRKSLLCGVLAGACLLAVSAARAQDNKEASKTAPDNPAVAATTATPKQAPEFIVFDKAKLGVVKFPHKEHIQKLGACDACHGGEQPLFAQKKTELKMAEMYSGKSCGQCHDGKEHAGQKVFAAKTSCMKCH
ncbi:MAG: hypothetical protein KGK30_10035, partial [Elusimicrobia bacterium]|nr:hypothetical protein [Elusimicrobiota bacterium]